MGNRLKVEFIPGHGVRINPANAVLNEFHYGEIDNLPALEDEVGTVIKPHYCEKAGEMSYLVQFNNVAEDNQHWFLEHELY